MAAILRVKRKNTDVPLDTLVIACKRPKTEVSLSETPTVQTIAQFAGTLIDPTEDVTKHVAKVLPKINVENQRTSVKRVSDDYPTISNKIPKWIDVDSERYKITDCQHSFDTLNEEESKDKRMTFILDVEDCWSTTSLKTQTKEDIEDYVYDLYYAQACDNIWFDSNNIQVRPDYTDIDFEEEKEDSADSNAESDWRNDYPDTDPDRSSKHSDSEDDFDIFNDDDDNDLYNSRSNNYVPDYRRKLMLRIHDNDLSDNEGYCSDNEEISDNEETSDNEKISNSESMENI